MITSSQSLIDGINRHILTVAPALNKSGVKVAVCIAQKDGGLAELLRKMGIDCYSLGCSSGHDLRLFTRFDKVLKEFAPDIIHIHVLPLFARVMLSLRYRKIKCVTTIHGIVDDEDLRTIKYKVDSFFSVLFKIDNVANIYISEGVRQSFCRVEEDSKIKNYVIYNPIDCDQPHAKNHVLSSLIGVSEQTKIIGTACRIASVKNPLAFTDIMLRVLEREQSAHAVIIGDGDDFIKRQMIEVIEKSPSKTRMHVVGYRENARELIGDFDCFIMTSQREGMPTAMLEAIAAGVPVVFWDGEGGLHDLVKFNSMYGPFGISIPGGDTVNMVESVIEIIRASKNKIEQIKKSGNQLCKDVLSVESISSALKNAYQDVLVQE